MNNQQVKQSVLAFISANNNAPHLAIEKFKLKPVVIYTFGNGIKKVGYYAGDVLCFELHE